MLITYLKTSALRANHRFHAYLLKNNWRHIGSAAVMGLAVGFSGTYVYYALAFLSVFMITYFVAVSGRYAKIL